MASDGDVLERVRPAVSDGGGGTVYGLPKLAAKAVRTVWAGPALLMLAVACYRVTGPELWRDELSSWSFASRPVPELVTIVRHSDASQLAYYLLLHYWMAVFGDSVLAMRMLSVLAMTGAAACVPLVGRRLAGDKAGLLAGGDGCHTSAAACRGQAVLAEVGSLRRLRGDARLCRPGRAVPDRRPRSRGRPAVVDRPICA
jgi:hypothetical protein